VVSFFLAILESANAAPIVAGLNVTAKPNMELALRKRRRDLSLIHLTMFPPSKSNVNMGPTIPEPEFRLVKEREFHFVAPSSKSGNSNFFLSIAASHWYRQTRFAPATI
jgi:hypothetical protein